MFPKGVNDIIISYISYNPLYLNGILAETRGIRSLLDNGTLGNDENAYWKRGDITRIVYWYGWGISEKNYFWRDLYWSHKNRKQFRRLPK